MKLSQFGTVLNFPKIKIHFRFHKLIYEQKINLCNEEKMYELKKMHLYQKNPKICQKFFQQNNEEM